MFFTIPLPEYTMPWTSASYFSPRIAPHDLRKLSHSPDQSAPGQSVPPGAAGGSPDGGTPIAGRQWTVAAVPGSTPDGGAVFGTPIPGQLPGAGFPMPAGSGMPQAAAGDAPVVTDASRAAGSGEALAAPPRGDQLSWPVLVAILLLAAVGAQLVRRWGVRRPR